MHKALGHQFATVVMIWLLFASPPRPAQAQVGGEQTTADPRIEIWQDTEKLLTRREYSLAANLLENRLSDSNLFQHTSAIQADLDVVRQLGRLSDTVEYLASKLETGAPLKVLSSDYRFERIEGSGDGRRIIVSQPGGRESRYAFARLDSKTWLQIANPEMESWPERELVTAVFLAFDRYPDPKQARLGLNAVASTGKDVSVWLQRLEAADQRRKQTRNGKDASEKTASELFLGKWALALKNGPQLRLDIRRGGAATVTFRNIREPGKWVEESPGVFRLTAKKTFVIHLSGNRMTGQVVGGKPFRGVRRAD